MLKKTLKGIIPVLAILAVAACADVTGPTNPDLQAVAEEDGNRQVDQASRDQHEKVSGQDQLGTKNR